MKNRIFMTAALLLALCLLLVGCVAGGENTQTGDNDTPQNTDDLRALEQKLAQLQTELENIKAEQNKVCTVTFDTRGCSAVAAQQVDQGDRVVKPEDPQRAGYAFTGWSYSGEPWSFIEHTVTGNMALTASWETACVTVSDQGVVTGLTAEGRIASVIEITPTVGGITVKSIGSSAFADNHALAVVIMPDSVTGISDAAFSGCTSLTSVTISNSVTGIGIGAFRNCTSLTNITLPGSVTRINMSAFSGCTAITSITFEGTMAQ